MITPKEICFMRNLFTLAIATVLLAGCNMNVKKDEKADGGKKVEISSDLGNLKVNTQEVDPKATGLTVYPGSRLKERDNRHDESQANVNIDTPWFALKVVAVTYESDDSPDKVWEYYKKDMAQYGRPLECRPGSPDLKLEKKNKDELTCYDDKDSRGARRRNRAVSISIDSMELKVGTNERQRIVAVKPKGSGTEYSLVYVVTREGRESI
jgi:hypothetical protein